MEGLITALETAYSSGATSVMGAIGDLVPVVMPVGLGIVAIRVTWRVFRMMTGR